MKYVGIYWSLFAPMIKKSIRERFDFSLAERTIREGKKEYKRLLSRADELGPGNPMAMNAYFAYVFAAAWLGSGRTITPEEMALVMTDVLESKLLRTVFGMTDLNRQPKKWYRDMKKYEAWFEKHGKDYPVNWNIHFDGSRHRDGSFYYLRAARSANSAGGKALRNSCQPSVPRMRSCSACSTGSFSGNTRSQTETASAIIGSLETG